jgi:hypothetical protein
MVGFLAAFSQRSPVRCSSRVALPACRLPTSTVASTRDFSGAASSIQIVPSDLAKMPITEVKPKRSMTKVVSVWASSSL